MSTLVTAVYLALVVAAIAVEIIAQLKPDRIEPLGVRLSRAANSRINRVGLTAAWWWFGWHFLFAQTIQTNL